MDIESEEAEEVEEANVRQLTSSEIFFTKEERDFRRNYRNTKSECCVEKAWALYNKLADIPKAREEEPEKEDEKEKQDDLDTLDLRKMGVLYDPTTDMRRRHFAHKYSYLKNALNIVKQAPEKPYMRPQKPRMMDIPGQRFTQPQVVKRYSPEVIKTDIVPPEKAFATPAYTRRWLNISNLNFVTVCKTDQAQTQTSAAKLLKSEKLPKSDQAKEIPWDEKPDLNDIPIDDDGNPIGKRTGFCEWCGKHILPIPPIYILRRIWDRTPLYCCKKYQQMVEETTALEEFLLKERNILACAIDVRPHIPRPDLRTAKVKSEEEDKEEKLKEPEETVSKPVDRSPEPPPPCKPIRDLLDTRRLVYEAALRQRRKEIGVDTFDLPWDPYETRYKHPNPFNDDIFDDPRYHMYFHPAIVMEQSEIFLRLSSAQLHLASSDSSNSVEINRGESQENVNV